MNHNLKKGSDVNIGEAKVNTIVYFENAPVFDCLLMVAACACVRMYVSLSEGVCSCEDVSVYLHACLRERERVGESSREV